MRYQKAGKPSNTSRVAAFYNWSHWLYVYVFLLFWETVPPESTAALIQFVPHASQRTVCAYLLNEKSFDIPVTVKSPEVGMTTTLFLLSLPWPLPLTASGYWDAKSNLIFTKIQFVSPCVTLVGFLVEGHVWSLLSPYPSHLHTFLYSLEFSSHPLSCPSAYFLYKAFFVQKLSGFFFFLFSLSQPPQSL